MATDSNDFLDDAINEVVQEGAPGTLQSGNSSSDIMLDDAIESVGGESRALNSIGALQSLQADPEKYAEHLQLGKSLGLPVDLVGRNYDTLKKVDTRNTITRLLDKNAALGRWYTDGDNHATIKVDELRHYDGLSWLLSSAAQGFGDGRSQAELSNLRYKQLIGLASEGEIAAANRMSADQEPRTFGADTWLQRGWVGAAQQMPNFIESFAGGLEGGVKGAIAGAGAALLAGQAGPQIAVPEEILTVPGAASVGYKMGAASGQYMASFRLEGGAAFDEFLNYRDENGEKLDEDVARVAAMIVGGTNAGLELLSLRTMAKVVPGLDKIAGTLSKDVVASALTRPTVRDAFKNFAINTLKVAGTEVSTEVIQEASTMFAGILAQQYGNAAQGQQFPAATGEDIAARLGSTLQQTLETMTVLGPVLSGTRLGSDVQRARRSAQDQAFIGVLVDHAQADEFNKRLPEKAKEAVRALSENSEVENVFMDPSAFQTYFQSAEELSRFVGAAGLTEEFNDALRTGRDMVIPIEAYYTNIAGTEFGLASRQYAKLSLDNMTPIEAQDFNDAWAEAQQSLVEEYQSSQPADNQAMESFEVIHDDVKAKAMNAGIVPDQAEQYAKLYSTFFRVMAERTLQDPGELYSRYGFDIRRALPGGMTFNQQDSLGLGLSVIRSGRVPALRRQVERSRGRSLTQRIRDIGGIVDTGGELAAMNVPAGVSRPTAEASGDILGGLSDNQFMPDSMALRLWQEGYFPEFDDRPSPDVLLEAIRDELAGNPRYGELDTSQTDQAVLRAQELIDLADILDQLGLDPASMDDASIRAALEEATNLDPDTNAFYQSLLDTQYTDPEVTELNQGMENKRGSIQLREGQTIINLFEQADLSTFLHETGHFFLEVTRDLATMEGAPESLGADWQVVREYLGIKDDGTIPTEAHEKFARTFEAYLFEGKAPSNEVAGIMARFRSWLAFIYRSVADLNVPINDRIRGVMDRMIASDQEIESARFSPDFRPAFKNAEEAGMTETQWQDYIATAGRAVEQAKANLTARMLQDVARETTQEWRSARREIRNSVEAEYERLPVYRVIRYLRTGQSEEMQNEERTFLDKQSIINLMGEGALSKLPRGTYRVQGGVHPDVMAEIFGFQSGTEMLTQMMGVPPLRESVREETNRRMREQYGDVMGDAVARAREVSAAVANDATGDLLAAEMEVLMKKGLVTSKVRKSDARRVARETIRNKTIRDAIRSKMYLNADARAAREAEQAILAQDWVTAVAAKQRQLLNHYMAMESIQAEKDIESAVKYLNKFTSRKRPLNIDPDYLDQIEGLLERFDLRKSVTLKDSQRRASLAAWIQEQEAQGNVVAVPDVLRNDAFRKPYRDMTVDDMMALRDSVKSIEHLGRLKDKLLSSKKEREFNEVRDELLTSIEASQAVRKTPKTRNPTRFDKTVSVMRSMEAMLLKMEQVFEWMDNGDINGPFNKNIWRPIAEAESREQAMRNEYVGKFMATFAKLDKSRLNDRISIPGLDRTFLRSEIMAVALNMGSESNLDKMMRGEGWQNNPGILDALVGHLNEAEWSAVQEIWDTVNGLWPEISALQRRLTGVVPEKVESRSFTAPTGQAMKGGYYPMIYDPSQVVGSNPDEVAIRRAGNVTDRMAMEADRVMFENVYLKPETRHGFTNERSQAFAMPLLFDLEGIGRHINAVIHDVTHREAIMDAHKLLTNPQVRYEIESRYGRETYQQIVPWLQNIAHDPFKSDGLAPAERFFKGVRSRTTLLAMGFKIGVSLQQLAGILPVLDMVDGKTDFTKHYAGALKDFVTSPRDSWDIVTSNSGFMRDRAQMLDRDIRDKINELTGKDDMLSQVSKFAFYGIGYMDRVVAAPVWLASYRQQLAKAPEDHAGAVAYADHIVSLSQGSGGAKDLAAIQRNSELTKLVTFFYSYFSAYYNRQRNWARDADRAIRAGDVRELPDLLARQVFMTIGPAIIGELLAGRGPDSDDDESFAAWAAKTAALYPFAALPVIRDVMGAMTGPFGYSLSPTERTLGQMFVDPVNAVSRIASGEADARRTTKTLLNAAALWFKLPVGQLITIEDNIWRGIEEDGFQLRDLVYNKAPKK